jgi:hypothetical protein
MRTFRLAWFAVIAIACGGTTSDIDGGADATADSTTSDAALDASGKDGSATDASADVSEVDAAECVSPDTACTTPCAPGTYCLKASGPQEHDLGCTPIPAACNGTATCDCMKSCFCNAGIDQCVAGTDYLECNNGAVSRREFKKDIDYVNEEEREDLARQALAVPLARYRYKTEPESQERHLGFIIDDQPTSSPAVASDRTHVDLYGYTSMLLATVQEQQKQIDALRAQVDELHGAAGACR